MTKANSSVSTERVKLTGKERYLFLWVLAVICFLVTPLVALLWRALPGLLIGARSPLVADALGLSLLTTFITTLISVLVGTPAAY